MSRAELLGKAGVSLSTIYMVGDVKHYQERTRRKLIVAL